MPELPSVAGTTDRSCGVPSTVSCTVAGSDMALLLGRDGGLNALAGYGCGYVAAPRPVTGVRPASTVRDVRADDHPGPRRPGVTPLTPTGVWLRPRRSARRCR
ncbi:hypothetical protein Cde04nite_23240 [Cellulomonas denverensis]|nr:hypothetical protein Cde04nite_23240 [Cellulomonas denverensis]